MPKQCKEKAMHPSTWKVNSAKLNFALTEFSEVRATLRRLFLLRTDHQHWAVGLPHNRVRYAARRSHLRRTRSPGRSVLRASQVSDSSVALCADPVVVLRELSSSRHGIA